MKYYYFTLITFFFAIGCTENKSGEEDKVVVHPLHSDFFYSGIDNPIYFKVNAEDNAKISFELAPGTIIKTDSGYIARVKDVARAQLIIIEKDLRDEDYPLFEKTYTIRRLPKPDVYVGDKSFGKISKTNLLGEKELTIRLKHNDYNVSYDVKHFTLSAYVAGKEVAIKSQSGKFTDEQKKLIKKLKSGSKIYIDEIKVQQLPHWKYTEPIYYRLPPLILTIE